MFHKSLSQARFVSSAAVSTALVFVATSSISVYIPATRGYFNLGDSMIFLTALLFGPTVGCIAGGLGSMLSDIFLGYTIYAPATLVVKGFEGLITGFLHAFFTNKGSRAARLLIALLPIPIVVLGSIMVIVVFAGEAEVSLLTLGSATVGLQSVLFSIIALLTVSLIFIMRLHGEGLRLIVPCFIGGFEMVIGYFLYELFLVGLGAVAELPANFAQTFLGTLIAVPVYNAINRRIGDQKGF